MTVKKIETPLTEEVVMDLRAGDNVLITGVIYSARDAAHKKLVDLLDKGEPLPVDLRGQVIYYVGPTPAKPGQVIGSAGPTTSGRMDSYTPALLAQGVKGLVGKGSRSQPVKDALREYGALYFASVGGAAALTARTIKSSEVVAYEELGAEAIRRMEVVDFPATVVNDAHGDDLYVQGAREYARG